MPRAWAALLLAARGAASSRHEDVLAVSRAVAASQELLASQPGCSEAATGTGSTQALSSCVDSLQRHLAEVSAQSTRSHTANARYAADMQAASSLLRRLQDEQRAHASRFEALGQQLRASAELDHGAAAGTPGASDLPEGTGVAAPNPGLLQQSQAKEAAHVELDERGRLHASRQPGPPARGLLQGEERLVAAKARPASPGPPSSAGTAEAGEQEDPAPETFTTRQLLEQDPAPETFATPDASSPTGSSVSEDLARPAPEAFATPGASSSTGPSVNEEAGIVRELHRETQKAASTAGKLLEAERDGEGTTRSLEADLRRKKQQLEARRAQLDEQKQAFESAEQANYRSGNETARQRETLAGLEAESQRARQAHARELLKLQDLELRARAAADAGEAARATAEKTVRAATAKKDELRTAINHLNDLQDQLAELRGESASAAGTPTQDRRSWSEKLFG